MLINNSNELPIDNCRELNEYAINMVETVPGALILLDKDWRIVYTNNEAESIFGHGKDELCGKALEDVYPKNLSLLLNPDFLKDMLLRGDKGSERYSNQLKKWYHVSVYKSKQSIAVMLEDISDRMINSRLLRLTQFSVNNQKDMTLWFKLSGHIIYANNSACDILGYTKDELTRMKVWEIDPGYTQSKWANLVYNVKKKGSLTIESSQRSRDSKIIPVEITCNYVNYHDEDYIVAVARDITERKQAENALRESEERYRGLFESSLDGIVTTDIAGNIMKVNLAFQRMLGYSEEEIQHINYQRLTPARWHDMEERIVQEQVIHRGYSDEYEKEYIRKDGSELPISIRVWLIKDNLGRPQGMWGIVRDITERKRDEEALRETRDYLESLINYANAPIIVWDPTFTITRFNHAFERLSGYAEAEVLGKYLSVLFPPDSREESLDKIKRTLAGEYWESVEIPILHRDGGIRIALWNSANIYGEHGALLATIAQGQDITERKKAEEELANAKAQAELYLDLMSHDINNLNQVALGYLELIDGMIKDQKLKELISKPIDAVNNSTHLIENVRKLQKARMGQLKAEAVELNKVLFEIQAQYSQVPGKNVTTNYKYCSDCMVMADGLINDVFSNLVWNAIKHSNGESVQINLELKKQWEEGKEYCKVVVEDDGPGIPDAQKEQVFARFQRGNTKASGKGLGLYLVKTLVEGYQGRVWVEDRMPGDHTKGARFVVMLPAIEKLL
jgi:PAS domain S-box-containing protein